MEMRSEMIRKDASRQTSGLRRAASLGAVLVLLIALDAGPAAAAPKRCGDFVPTGSVYSCNVTPIVGAPFHDCFTVTSSSSPGFTFTMPLIGSELAVVCACDATGTTNPVLFGSRSSFTCDTRDAPGDAFGLSGKLVGGGKRIVGGNMIAAGTFVWAFSCNLDPECTP
jgi:hypothetical protein